MLRLANVAEEAERQLQELWERREVYLKQGRTIAAQCAALRIECEWIMRYSTLLQLKMMADAQLALRNHHENVTFLQLHLGIG